jgi:hypothetical protein
MQLLRQRALAVPAYTAIEVSTLSWGGAYCRPAQHGTPQNAPMEGFAGEESRLDVMAGWS